MADAMTGVSDAEIDQVTEILTRVRNNLTGKETVVPFADPKPAARPKAPAKSRSPIKQGFAS
jgi:hypothetical protein